MGRERPSLAGVTGERGEDGEIHKGAEAATPRADTVVEPGAGRRARRPFVVSTACLIVALALVFLVVVVVPAALWAAGIACGGAGP